MTEEGAEPRHSHWPKVWIVALSLLVLVLCGVILLGWLRDFIVFGTFNFALHQFEDATGLSPYLIKGILVIALVPFFLALRDIGKIPLFKSKGRMPKALAWGIVLVYVSAYFIAMFFATRGQYFHHLSESGQIEAAKYYALTPDGIVYSDTAGVERTYGIEFKPVTPQLMQNLRRKELGKIPRALEVKDPEHIQFFDGLTQEAQVWYDRRGDGSIVLFSTSGINPETGTELRPVTPEVVAEVRKSLTDQQAKREEQAKQATAEQRHQEREAVASRLIDTAVTRRPGAAQVAVLAASVGLGIDAVSLEVTRALRNRGLAPVDGFFRAEFLKSGDAAKLLDSDWGLVRQLELSDHVSGVVVASAKSAVTASEQFEGLKTARLSVRLLCLDVVSQRTCGASEFQATGAGYSDGEAVETALRNSRERISAFVAQASLR